MSDPKLKPHASGELSTDSSGNLHFDMRLHVYMEDTDAGGIVYYVNYLKFMERARTDMFRALGFAKPAVFSDELMFVVHEIQAKYHRPAELDDELLVSAVIRKLSKATVYFYQKVERLDLTDGSKTLLCESEIKIASVNRRTLKPAAIPDALRQLLTDHSS